MYPEITNDGYLSVTVGSSDIHNVYPKHPQNFQSWIPLAGYELYSSWLNKPRLSGFISDDAITLLDRMGLQPCWACYFQTRFIFRHKSDYVWSDRAKEFAPQTRQSLVAASTWDLKTNLLCEVGALGTPQSKGMVPAWAAAWLRDYDIGCWYEAYCIPAEWLVTEWQLQGCW